MTALVKTGILTPMTPEEEETWFWEQFTPSDLPTVRLVEITSRCQMTCYFCGQNSMPRPKRHMKEEEFALALERVAETGQTGVGLYGYGESLLHPQVADFVALATQRGLDVQLSTVPVYLTEEMSSRLLDAGLKLINFSIDSLNTETFRAMRGKHAKLDVAIANVRTFLRLNEERGHPARTQIRMVCVPENSGEEGEFVAFWRAEGVDIVYARPYIYGMGGDHSRREHAKTALPEFVTGWESGILCDWPWRGLVLWQNGIASACCLDSRGEIAMGNWKTTTLRDIWEGGAYSALRRELKENAFQTYKACSGCRHAFGYIRDEVYGRGQGFEQLSDFSIVAWEF